ncbi:hypothetical protein niasHT_016193 [Heterodera trifolii]|uniref:F-box domain-containing protein n=1 Tax=Heterodera trifolii TaxID=157864 RepID=A0ABD2KTZ0_9BILA
MVPKCLPLELLYEIVPFIPAENAVPNALSSCRLLHKLLLPRVIKWKEQLLTDLMSFSAIVNNLSAKVDNLSGVVNNLSAKVDNLSGVVNNLSAKVDNLSGVVNNHSVKLETIEKKMGISGVVERFELRAGGRMPTKGNEKGGGSGQKVVMGDYNENNGTIEVPLHGYNVGKAIAERILNTESGTVVLHGMREPISLAKAVEVGFFDNLSLTVVDPNTLKVLFLDEALRRKVLDSNGRMQHRHQLLTLHQANRQRLVCLEKSKPTIHKKIIKLESGSPKTSIQPDKTSNSTSSTSNIYPKSDKPSDSTSDSSIQPDKTSTEPDKMPSTSITSIQPDKTSMAVIGDYNENKGTIKVPYHGYHIGQAINERILDAESGTVLLHGMREPISLAKAVEIGFFDNLSLSVADPNTLKVLFLDEALGRKVLDSNGRLQHRQLKLSEAMQQGFVHIGSKRATRDCRKKTLKLEPRSPQTSIQLDKTSNSISNKSTEPDKTSSISNYPKSDKPSNRTSDSSIQPDKTSISTSSTSNIYPKSDKPSNSTSDSSIQPDKTSMAVIGDYNENNDTIEVPLHGYNIGKMIVEGILDAESGTVVVDGMHEPISLAKAVEIGFFDNLSLTVAEPNTMKMLFLDEALELKVLDSNGRLQHRQLKLSEAIEQRLVLLVKSKPTIHKKIIKLESGSPKTSIQPDKTSNSTSSTSNIYPKSDKPSDSTSDSSIQPDKTSMDFWNFTSMVTLINEAIRMNSSMERGDLLEMLCMYGPTTCENALDTPDQLESFVAEHCPSVRIESVGKGNGAKKFFHWNSADDQTWKAGLDRMAKGVQSVENPMKAKVIKRTMEKRTDDHSSDQSKRYSLWTTRSNGGSGFPVP